MVNRAIHLGTSWGAAYAGPGDVSGFSGALAYGGLRAFNAVKAAALQSLIDVTDQADGNAATFACTSSGYLDLTAVSAWVAANSVSAIKVTKVYDQIGGNHFVAPAAAPRLVLNQIAGLPAFTFDGSSYYLRTTSTIAATAQPLHFAFITKPDSTNAGMLSSTASFGLQNYIFPASGSFRWGGDVADVDAAIGITRDAWHSIQSMWSGASSTVKVDSAAPVTAGSSPGTAGFGGTSKWTIGAGTEAGSTPFGGAMYEFMLLAGSPSSGDQALLNTNQHAIGTTW